MINILYKAAQISLMVLGLIHTSQAMDLDPTAGISESLQTNIGLQLDSYNTNNLIPKAIIPEEENYDDPTDLQGAENIYHVPEVKSLCGFLCGRCQFLHYAGSHPNHDCCSSSDILGIKDGIRSPCGDVLLCGLFNIVDIGLCGVIPTICTPGGLLSRNFTFTGFLPVTVTSSMAVQMLMGPISYLGAHYMGNTDFTDSYERGELCLPEDAFSCTSCFGVGYYGHRNKYKCCCIPRGCKLC